MDYSFIIVNYNSKNLLSKCLKSIYNNLATANFNIIVVDNASTDDSIEMIENDFPLVEWIKNKNNSGYGAAINLGLKSSKGKVVWYLNSDDLFADNSVV